MFLTRGALQNRNPMCLEWTYNEIGPEGLTDQSRRPANQLPFQIETQIVRLKQDKAGWGAAKIRDKLIRLYPDVHTPAISTAHAVLAGPFLNVGSKATPKCITAAHICALCH